MNAGKLRRFFVREIKPQNGMFAVRGSEAKHISRVLRMRPGERLILMDGRGSRFQALIESASPGKVLVNLEKELEAPDPSPVKIILCQALLRSRPMDYLIQKTSELGVDQIRPFLAERSLIELNRKQRKDKLRHWMEVARSAAKQADRAAPAEVAFPSGFREMIAGCKEGEALRVIFWEMEKNRELRTLLLDSPVKTRFIALLGPEGGFSSEEVSSARKAGFVPVSLGHRILRAETAAIAVSAIVQYEWGDLGPQQAPKD